MMLSKIVSVKFDGGLVNRDRIRSFVKNELIGF